MKPTISLCMIVKDEEKLLEGCLKPIKELIDEIIIIDTGSIDKTKEIANKLTNKVYNFEWCDDFSEARNFSIEKATKEWILILDADEILTKEDLIKIKEIIKNNNKDTLGYRIIQETYYKNKIVSIRGICRIFKNNKQIKFQYPIHETVRNSIKEKNKKIGKTGIVIKHFPRLDRDKTEYYLKLLKTKKEYFPESNVDKEIENEKKLKF
jgi:glycosyltransferase involved in cell wall biosynthesis